MGEQIAGKPVTDRRAIRTRAALAEAFIRLLETTPYTKITISAVAREAGINRKTFYLHYQSIDDLLRTLVQQGIYESVEEVAVSLALSADCRHSDPEQAFDLLTTTILEQLAKNSTLDSRIANNVPTNTLLEIATEPMRSLVEHLRQQRHATGVPHLDYLVACYLGAIIACYREWKSEPQPRTPLAEVSTTICDLFGNKARELL